MHIQGILSLHAGSKNTNLYHYFYEFAKEKKMVISITSTCQPEVSILKGAVLFGLKNNIIRKRKQKIL